MRLTFKIEARCRHLMPSIGPPPYCWASVSHESEPSGRTVEQIAADARGYFNTLGWTVGADGTDYCPDHKPETP